MADDVPMIRIDGLTKRFGDEVVLDGVDLDVRTGESLVLVGRSGSGKTVLLKSIIGLIDPDSGSVQVAGNDTTHLSGRDRDRLLRRFGMLFQQSALFDSLPVWQNVAFRIMQESGMGRSEAREVALAKLRAVGLTEEDADIFPAELSGGMQKRVGFARAIAGEPEIILLDEPTAGLDPIMTSVVSDLIMENVHKLGATVISITSDMDGARQIADRIAMLHDGRITWCGPVSEADNSGNAVFDQFYHQRAEGPIDPTALD